MKIFNQKISFLLLGVLFISSCDFDRNEPGYSYFNDMEHSQAPETWSENSALPSGATMMKPVEGTVAIHETEVLLDKTPLGETSAIDLVNPYADQFDLEYSKNLYEINCIVCHGEKGDGQGHLFTSKLYPYPPANYHAERAMNKTDGQLYHNIRAGFGVMGAHGYIVKPEETWHLVNYIRHLQAQDVE